jgi:hypothetical protein
MKKVAVVVFILILVHLILLFFLRFTAWPEMILWPYLMTKGWLPYRDIILPYTPALVVMLGVLGKTFSVTLLNLKIYTWLLILFTDLIVYWTAKKISGREIVGLVSLLFYVLWQPFFEGNGFWFDLVLAPILLLTFYFIHERRYLTGGLFFGLAIAIKQTSLFLGVPVFLTLFWVNGLVFKNWWRFIVGTLIPLFICLIYVLGNSLFEDFFQWAISYGMFYLPRAPGQVQLPTVKQVLATGIPYGFLILAVLITFLGIAKKSSVKMIWILIGWVVFAALGVYPRWEYFHFQPSLPFLAIITGIAFQQVMPFARKKVWLILYCGILLMGTIYLQARFYRLQWRQPDRFFEKETVLTGKWLRENLIPGEKIFILNTWDHLYALGNVLPAVDPWIPPLPWYMEYPGVQDKAVRQLEKERPKLIVFEPYRQKGLGSYIPGKIDKFIQDNYTKREVIAGRFWIFELKSK